MKSTEITREEMWAKQHLSANEIDYAIWEQDKVVLQQMSQISRSCSFVVDVYKYRYAFASSNFADILGYDSRKNSYSGEAGRLFGITLSSGRFRTTGAIAD